MRNIIIVGCSTLIALILNLSCEKSTAKIERQLSAIDSLLQYNPSAALDSLSTFTVVQEKLFDSKTEAYYYLLLTSAQHKTNHVFISDSAIAVAKEWYEKEADSRDKARAFFYYGLVTHLVSGLNDTTALRYMMSAISIIEEQSICDDRLKALSFSYCGRIHDRALNYEEAISFYKKAIEVETHLGNNRNLLFNYCDYLICLVKSQKQSEAQRALFSLDSLSSCCPDLRIAAINNAKTIYYLHCDKNLDSALFYCMKWNPPLVDKGTKYKLLATICRERGDFSQAIEFEKAAYSMRRPADTLSYHVYFRNLADLYEELGQADSTAHYAQLAYQSLYNNFVIKTDKRILELEKLYDLSAKQTELDKAKSDRRLLRLILIFMFVATGMLTAILLLTKRNLALAKQEQIKDAIAQSIVKAVVATYAGINNKLSVIHNLPEKQRQAALERLIVENRSNSSTNLIKALEENNTELPKIVRDAASVLDGAQQKAVFVLTEMGFSPSEAASLLGISSSQVRTVKKKVRERIQESEFARHSDIRQLQVLQVGKQVGKKE